MLHRGRSRQEVEALVSEAGPGPRHWPGHLTSVLWPQGPHGLTGTPSLHELSASLKPSLLYYPWEVRGRFYSSSPPTANQILDIPVLQSPPDSPPLQAEAFSGSVTLTSPSLTSTLLLISNAEQLHSPFHSLVPVSPNFSISPTPVAFSGIFLNEGISSSEQAVASS